MAVPNLEMRFSLPRAVPLLPPCAFLAGCRERMVLLAVRYTYTERLCCQCSERGTFTKKKSVFSVFYQEYEYIRTIYDSL